MSALRSLSGAERTCRIDEHARYRRGEIGAQLQLPKFEFKNVVAQRDARSRCDLSHFAVEGFGTMVVNAKTGPVMGTIAGMPCQFHIGVRHRRTPVVNGSFCAEARIPRPRYSRNHR
jgi:hypothetical protein